VLEAARRARVEELLAAARILADPATAASQRLRERLRETTGLSRPSIDFALERCLEQRASPLELTRLLERTPLATRALVLLSANVFVAPLRAIAIARAASPRVIVRPSRRDPALAQALAELLPGAFELTPELQAQPSDALWAYGSDETLERVRAGLPAGVAFYGHGFGFGAVVVDEVSASAVEEDARAIALDAVLFDQQGCLSPRLVCVMGSERATRQLAEALAIQLSRHESALPPAVESPEQLAERRRFLDAATYAFEVVPAGRSIVSVSLTGHLVLPPSGRHLHVARLDDAPAALAAFRRYLTCLGVRGPSELRHRLTAYFPGARCVELGQMQTPPLDGPVDLRGAASGSGEH
jgi:hypothetical protein